MAYYTLKVRARRLLCEALLERPERVKAARLKPADLRKVIDTGKAAEEADGRQRAELAAGSAEVTARAGEIAAALSQESELRDVMAAVAEDLADNGNATAATFVKRLSYARFRIRELAPTPADGELPAPDAEKVRKLERVQREDQVARLDGLAGFLGAILEPGREPIVAELVERDFTAAGLTELAAKAKALAEQGRNLVLAAESTGAESTNVVAQAAKWTSIRRLVRKASAGDAELERLLAAC